MLGARDDLSEHFFDLSSWVGGVWLVCARLLTDMSALGLGCLDASFMIHV